MNVVIVRGMIYYPNIFALPTLLHILYDVLIFFPLFISYEVIFKSVEMVHIVDVVLKCIYIQRS